jgi:hypothetical protein
MSNSSKLPNVIKELKQLKRIESRLQDQWDTLKDSGKKVHTSFLTSLADLETRASDLERLLDA